MPRGLAIDCDETAERGLGNALDPVEEAMLQGLRIEQSEDAIKRVMGGNAVGQFEKGLQPIQFTEAIVGHVHPGIGAGDDSKDGNGDDVPEVVQPPMLAEWGGDGGETLAD